MGSRDDPVEVEGSGSDGSEDNESSGGGKDGAAKDVGSVSSAEEQDDHDGNGNDDEGEEQEKEEEQVCVDCGKSPCAFQAEVSNLVQFGINREWHIVKMFIIMHHFQCWQGFVVLSLNQRR
jgi:hypothetical protein